MHPFKTSFLSDLVIYPVPVNLTSYLLPFNSFITSYSYPLLLINLSPIFTIFFTFGHTLFPP